ncbi:hypothetical protein NQ317_019632 [Molorchus minor]|uniref:RRM domain-containing protein n=1 Tax=Molorchus minor TaxID=1323400 RepID=A0ABQ9JD95_9CUCU|nr:hypothetical protein NQ317_019632 [Molorchus minor]
MKMGTRVFVGGLTYKVRERDIEKFFRKYGKIKEVSMKNGFAFVEFDDHRDADDAIYELNGRDLLGEKVSVERARGTPRGSDQWRGSLGGSRSYGKPPQRRDNLDMDLHKRTRYRIYVDNLSSRISWQDLKDYMRQAGEVTFADAHKQRRNEGFASYKDMKNVIEKLDGTELNGRKIKLVEDRQSKRSRSKSRSSSRSRSRSRSSRSRRSASKRSSKSRSRTPNVKARDKSDRSRSSKSDSRSQSPNTTRDDI